MLSTRRKILLKIQRRGRGGLWCADDFLSSFQRHEIDESLVRLAAVGVIRRVIPGIYEYPRFSEILKSTVPTDTNALAAVLARKFSWTICPDGETALNYLGLSTQLSGHSLYYSDGANRRYDIAGQTLEFHHTANRWLRFKQSESLMVVQGLKARGEAQVSEMDVRILARRFSLDTWEVILSDISAAPGWIVEIVRGICRQRRNREADC